MFAICGRGTFLNFVSSCPRYLTWTFRRNSIVSFATFITTCLTVDAYVKDHTRKMKNGMRSSKNITTLISIWIPLHHSCSKDGSMQKMLHISLPKQLRTVTDLSKQTFPRLVPHFTGLMMYPMSQTWSMNYPAVIIHVP